MSNPQPETRPAAAPFNSDDGDIVMRSSDNVDFCAHKLILAQASPVLKGILEIPQPRPSTESIRPVVRFSEDSTTLDSILRMLYGVPSPPSSDIDYVRPVLAAAEKYEFHSVAERVRERLMDWAAIEREPLRVYGLACGAGFEDVARQAAKLLVRHPIGGPYSEDLRCMTGGAYHRLVEYHEECGRAACAALGSAEQWVWNHCEICPTDDSKGRSRRYIHEYFHDVCKALAHTPHAAVITDPLYTGPVVRAACLCKRCAPLVCIELSKFVKILQQEIEDSIAKVWFHIRL
ncbi:hypothetical protein OBBRIDRAFT_782079 [Obba rivulosa]|uniref:BTB domain-containing protein n=1 Tax=Obba rivulosa TaxID=1052685 RepID=A0A8E2AXC6_9APHY|nr:hypothetical protein OBBRIDRAFT_782079 [Obba rivulosa]